MRLKTKWMLYVMTVCLVLSGSAMPFAVSWIQEYGLSQQLEIRELQAKPLPLGPEDPALRTLEILSGNVAGFELSVEFDREEALIDLEEVSRKLLEAELLPPEFANYDELEIYTFLVFPEGEDAHSILLRQYIWFADASICVMELETASGKMVHLYAAGPGIPGVPPEDYAGYARRWADFCSSYYNVTAAVLPETRQVNGDVVYSIVLTNEKGFRCELPLIPQERMLWFNE